MKIVNSNRILNVCHISFEYYRMTQSFRSPETGPPKKDNFK